MGAQDGKLRHVWEVHCRTCERPALGLAANSSAGQAAIELRREGWDIRNGRWVCFACASLHQEQTHER